jgi:nucleoid-associated protein YgaU
VLFANEHRDLRIVVEEIMNTFSLSSWILQSITLFLAILASIPLLKAIIGLSLVAISETFKLENQAIRRTGIKLMPAFLRAGLGLGMAIGFTSPASAETPLPQIPVIDRVINFETEIESTAEKDSAPSAKSPAESTADPVVEVEPVSEPEIEPNIALEGQIKQVDDVETTNPRKSYVIKSGDSLWSIAQSQIVGEAASVTEIDNAWRKIWRANREVIGNNPSLIRPGQEINLDVVAN